MRENLQDFDLSDRSNGKLVQLISHSELIKANEELTPSFS